MSKNPKISAVLNNCPLHALTPEIKTEVLKFAGQDTYTNKHDEFYLLLKDTFATFYELDPLAFNWEQFAHILKSYNAFDTQIIFGPVLRFFMETTIKTDELTPILAQADDLEVEDYVSKYTDISLQNGRYFSLSPEELAVYVSKPLGLNLHYYKDENEYVLHAINPISTVSIYHQGGIDGAQAGGHWERTRNGEQSDDWQNQDDTQLASILDLMGQDPALNEYGFSLLKWHVKNTQQTVIDKDKSTKDFAEYKLTVSQINHYLYANRCVPKAVSETLLGKNVTDFTQEFIKKYPLENHTPTGEIYESYIKQPNARHRKLNDDEQNILEKLLSLTTNPGALEDKQYDYQKIIIDELTANNEENRQYILLLQQSLNDAQTKIQRLQHEAEQVVGNTTNQSKEFIKLTHKNQQLKLNLKTANTTIDKMKPGVRYKIEAMITRTQKYQNHLNDTPDETWTYQDKLQKVKDLLTILQDKTNSSEEQLALFMTTLTDATYLKDHRDGVEWRFLRDCIRIFAMPFVAFFSCFTGGEGLTLFQSSHGEQLIEDAHNILKSSSHN